MKNIIFAIALILTVAGCAAAQARTAKVRFASVYSNFTTDCKNFDGEGGSDGYSLCRGPGGYRIRIYYSAASTHYNAEIAKDETSNFPIATASIGHNDRKTRVEWRTANGKPFAVIMRVPTYAAPTNEMEYYGKVNGSKLVIAGLKGIEIEGEVNASEPNPNAKAREIADAAYLKAKGN